MRSQGQSRGNQGKSSTSRRGEAGSIEIPNSLSEVMKTRIKKSYEDIQLLLQTSCTVADKVTHDDDLVEAVKRFAKVLIGELKTRSFSLDNAAVVDVCAFGEKAEASIKTFIEARTSECALKFARSKENEFDHFNTEKMIFLEKPVMDTPVFFPRNFETGDVLTEALDSLRMVKGTKGIIDKSIDNLLEMTQYLAMANVCHLDEKQKSK